MKTPPATTLTHSRRHALSVLSGVTALSIPTATAVASEAQQEVRVVYHLDDASDAIATVRMVHNHLKADSSVRIVVVALASGVELLLVGGKDARGNPYEPMVDDLSAAGVVFRACGNTLAFKGIPATLVHPEARVVVSGAAEISRLQSREGYAYYKP